MGEELFDHDHDDGPELDISELEKEMEKEEEDKSEDEEEEPKPSEAFKSSDDLENKDDQPGSVQKTRYWPLAGKQ